MPFDLPQFIVTVMMFAGAVWFLLRGQYVRRYPKIRRCAQVVSLSASIAIVAQLAPGPELASPVFGFSYLIAFGFAVRGLWLTRKAGWRAYVRKRALTDKATVDWDRNLRELELRIQACTEHGEHRAVLHATALSTAGQVKQLARMRVQPAGAYELLARFYQARFDAGGAGADRRAAQDFRDKAARSGRPSVLSGRRG
ncbi:hypothetical protein [Longispora albida]|uniref:hypothetical protein n=1 Tax=Longispora albida TaxID=203523 RepID=UPI00039BB035|nr:hypothetical protein [Longispora albida]